MTKVDELRLVEKRAAALLFLNLTARNDLIVTEQTDDLGADFLVQVTRNRKPTGRVFGIELKASVYASPDARVQIPVRRLSLYRDNPYPVCLCFFFMSNDKGFYRWLIEPVVERAAPRLSVNFEQEPGLPNEQTASFKISEFSELDKSGLSTLIASVNRWYDAR